MHDNQQPNLIALLVIMMVASILVVGIRCLAAWKLPHHKVGWDDILAAASLPFILASCSMIIWWVCLGLGKPAEEVPREDLRRAPLIIWADAFLYDTAISLPKFSALFFYLRIFGHAGNRWFRYANYFGFFLVGGWLLSAYLTTIFECKPVTAAFDVNVKGKCFPEWSWMLGTAVASMCIDLYILILPLPLLWGLQASWKKRIQVLSIFMCGYGVIAVSIGRVVSAAEAGDKLLSDPTWSDIPYTMWLVIEAPVSVISVSLPILFSYFRYLHVGRKQTSANMSNSSGNKNADPAKRNGSGTSQGFSFRRPARIPDLADESESESKDIYNPHGVAPHTLPYPYAPSSDFESDHGPEIFPSDAVYGSRETSYHQDMQSNRYEQ